METNPYYDRTIPWIPQQNSYDKQAQIPLARNYGQVPELQGQKLQAHNSNQKSRFPAKMPKARTLALATTLKKWLFVASLVSFGVFSGLAAFHQVGTTSASQSTKAAAAKVSGSNASTVTRKHYHKTSQAIATSTPTTNTNIATQNGGGSFWNQGGDNFGTNSSAQPASGSHVS